jgi:hypothetical protein
MLIPDPFDQHLHHCLHFLDNQLLFTFKLQPFNDAGTSFLPAEVVSVPADASLLHAFE